MGSTPGTGIPGVFICVGYFRAITTVHSLDFRQANPGTTLSPEPKIPPAQRMRRWGFSHKAGIPGRREVAALFRLRVGGDRWLAAVGTILSFWESLARRLFSQQNSATGGASVSRRFTRDSRNATDAMWMARMACRLFLTGIRFERPFGSQLLESEKQCPRH